jgi:hypothetical protein
VVDWAIAQETRTALGVLADDARVTAGGSGSRVVRRAEHRRYGNAQRAGDVHRAGIIGEEQAACGGKIDELAYGSFTG